MRNVLLYALRLGTVFVLGFIAYNGIIVIAGLLRP